MLVIANKCFRVFGRGGEGRALGEGMILILFGLLSLLTSCNYNIFLRIYLYIFVYNILKDTIDYSTNKYMMET